MLKDALIAVIGLWLGKIKTKREKEPLLHIEISE